MVASICKYVSQNHWLIKDRALIRESVKVRWPAEKKVRHNAPQYTVSERITYEGVETMRNPGAGQVIADKAPSLIHEEKGLHG